MAQESVEKFLGRLITDDSFRKTANQQFNQACYKHGFELTEQEQSLIQKIDFNVFRQLAGIIDDGIRRDGKWKEQQKYRGLWHNRCTGKGHVA